MKIFRVLLVLVMILTTSSALQAKKIQLKYNLEPGMEFALKHTLKQEIAQEVMGQSQVMENVINTRYGFKVIELTADGNYLLEEKIEGIKMVMENDFMNLNYDSDSDEEVPAELSFLINTLNIPVRLVINRSGEIQEIVDADEYIKKVNEALSAQGGPMQQMINGLAAQSGSLDGVKGQLGSLFLKYPGEKVKVGSVWNDETQSTQMVAFKNLIENTLVNADKQEATIKQTVNIEQLEMQGVEMEGMTMNYELSGRKDAGFIVDLSTGLIRKLDAVTNISGIISIESPQMASPMSMPMTIKMTETIELIN